MKNTPNPRPPAKRTAPQDAAVSPLAARLSACLRLFFGAAQQRNLTAEETYLVQGFSLALYFHAEFYSQYNDMPPTEFHHAVWAHLAEYVDVEPYLTDDPKGFEFPAGADFITWYAGLRRQGRLSEQWPELLAA